MCHRAVMWKDIEEMVLKNVCVDSFGLIDCIQGRPSKVVRICLFDGMYNGSVLVLLFCHGQN